MPLSSAGGMALTSLDLSDNPDLGPAVGGMMADFLSSRAGAHLVSIYLQGCKLGEQGVAKVAQALLSHAALQVLDLGMNAASRGGTLAGHCYTIWPHACQAKQVADWSWSAMARWLLLPQPRCDVGATRQSTARP